MRKITIVVLVFLSLALAVPVAADNGNGGGGVTARALAMLIAGLVAPYLIQWLKKLFGGLEARPALWLAFAAAVLLSALSLLVTGEMGWTPPAGEPVQAMTWFLEHVGVVFALATIVYHQFISKD